jgi:hypothetical protein
VAPSEAYCVVPPLAPHGEASFVFELRWTIEDWNELRSLKSKDVILDFGTETNTFDCSRAETICSNNVGADDSALR